jgi:cellulose synthase/poly-beta-1,6-N-acetylglucosamine synthase-like glycosyltransferase
MNTILIDTYSIFQIALLIFTGLATIYFFFFSAAGLFYNEKKVPDATKKRKFAVLIPGYKEDGVILEVAADALKQDYPADCFDVVIIADSFKEETLKALSEMPLRLIEVKFDKSTKAKALNKALSILPEDYDIALVLDADNLLESDFLSKMNQAFEKNFKAIQGHRTAKNLNTNLAVLDAISEEINNHIFRKGHRAIGLSSGIIGSGMAFDYKFFKNMMLEVKAIGGFDKEIELKMLKAGLKIDYLKDAIILDEKVQNSEAFTIQRRRWLSAQFHYFSQDIGSAFRDLILKGNVDYFVKAIQFIQPPRILLLGLVIVETSLFLLLNQFVFGVQELNLYWLIVFSACVAGFAFAIPPKFYSKQTAKAIFDLPKGMFLMLGSLLKIKGANKQFLHTPHGTDDKKSK